MICKASPLSLNRHSLIKRPRNNVSELQASFIFVRNNLYLLHVEYVPFYISWDS